MRSCENDTKPEPNQEKAQIWFSHWPGPVPSERTSAISKAFAMTSGFGGFSSEALVEEMEEVPPPQVHIWAEVSSQGVASSLRSLVDIGVACHEPDASLDRKDTRWLSFYIKTFVRKIMIIAHLARLAGAVTTPLPHLRLCSLQCTQCTCVGACEYLEREKDFFESTFCPIFHLYLFLASMGR